MAQTADVWDRVFTEGQQFADPAAPLRKRHRKAALNKRRDIQGLRAVAVLAVVVNHLTGHPVGGFVGVDVFFVISGFLITSHLLRDLDRTSGPRQYVGDFYRRRVRRLFPAALLTIALTVAAAYVLLSAARAKQTLVDGLWAAVFGANWHFAAVGTDYFGAAAPPSPEQHYWSLSVEEQFYLAWPIALFAVVALFGRRFGKRAAGVAAAAVLTVACLAYGAVQSASNPTVAYFSTLDRGWELGLGALLACVLPSLRMSPRVATVVSWAGLALIGISLFTVKGGTGFPVPGAILPVAGSALVIAAVAAPVNPVLTNPASVFIGDISYSLYLLHFPVIILMSAWIHEKGGYFYAAATLAAVGSSIGMYALVERPVLNSRWLLPSAQRRQDREIDNRPRTSRLVLGAACATVVGALALALWPGAASEQLQKEQSIKAAISAPQSSVKVAPRHSVRPPASQARRRRPRRTQLRKPANGDLPAAGPSELAAQLHSALLATRWPKLTPSIDSVINGPFVPSDIATCDTLTSLPASCTFGPASAPHTFDIVGDSQAVAWAESFRTVLSHMVGWRLHLVGAHNCSFADKVILSPSASIAAQCVAHNAAVVADIKAHRPDVLVVSNLANNDADAQSVANEINKVRRYVKKAIILGAPPTGADPRVCVTPDSAPSDCVTHVGGYYQTWSREMALAASTVSGGWIDVEDWFCYKGYCPEFADTTPMRFDGEHMSSAYAIKIAPVLAEALRSAGAFSLQGRAPNSPSKPNH